MTADQLTAILATRVMRWKFGPDRFLMGGRRWLPRWRFQPATRLEDAFRLLERAAPQEYAMGAVENGGFWASLGIAGTTGEARDYSNLAASWITREIADAATLRRVEDYEGREIVGQKKRNCAGILIPYYWPGDPSAFNHRLRRDNPDWTQGKNGKPKQERKYLSAPNGSNRIYAPPGVTREQLADPTIPITLAEGEKKALALRRLANHETEGPKFIPIAIARVWNWRGRIGKTGGPKGERLDVNGPIADQPPRVEWPQGVHRFRRGRAHERQRETGSERNMTRAWHARRES